MKLYGVLVLFVTFSVASGLRCYICVTSDPSGCTNYLTCPDGFDRCGSFESEGKNLNADCISPIQCCDKDLCNGALLTLLWDYRLQIFNIVTLFLVSCCALS
uniref:UPAR/Ly6 domain-containing protein n=1 Tax=Poecilia latipinna TaxID=48699 RepID=A0A3B3VMY1_9TELE